MPTYTFTRKQVISSDLLSTWSFFTSPLNLQAITPNNMAFKIISSNISSEIYAGQLIEYKIKPLPAISFYWMTEITHVVRHKYFIDEQRYGPYALWHHQHHFEEVEGGVLMTDIVSYRIGMGIIGRLAQHLYVKERLEYIFDYRYKTIAGIFGSGERTSFS